MFIQIIPICDENVDITPENVLDDDNTNNDDNKLKYFR